VGSPHLIHYLLGPIAVFAPALKGPIRGRRLVHVAQIASFIGQLHELGTSAEMSGVLNLKPLALSFR
jgi:hypothetical protein